MKYELVFMHGKDNLATHYFNYILERHDVVHIKGKRYSVMWREFVFDERDDTYESKRDYVIINLQAIPEITNCIISSTDKTS